MFAFNDLHLNSRLTIAFKSDWLLNTIGDDRYPDSGAARSVSVVVVARLT